MSLWKYNQSVPVNFRCRPATQVDPATLAPILPRNDQAYQTIPMSLFNQLREVITTTLKVQPEKVTETTTDENLAAWDSLGHVNLMIALEQTFDLFLDVEDFPTLTSVPAILKYLQDHGITDSTATR